MKRITLLLVLVLLLTVINVVSAQKDTKTDTDDMAQGISVNCDDGTSFDNGVSITVVQMRSGFTYKATAIGIDGFDPVLAVLDAETGTGLCEDDSDGVMEYSAFLPSGTADYSEFNAQIEFANTSDEDFADISLVVGGFGNLGGEFFLVLEGMFVDSENDGAGDPFSVYITNEMIASEVPLTAYAISADGVIDPLLQLINSDYEVLLDGDDNPAMCDDMGTEGLCWSDAIDMDVDGNGEYDDYYVENTETFLTLWDTDSYLRLALEEDDAGGYYNFATTSFAQSTDGYYMMVFHVGTSGME
jgi:hypothetical protein